MLLYSSRYITVVSVFVREFWQGVDEVPTNSVRVGDFGDPLTACAK